MQQKPYHHRQQRIKEHIRSLDQTDLEDIPCPCCSKRTLIDNVNGNKDLICSNEDCGELFDWDELEDPETWSDE